MEIEMTDKNAGLLQEYIKVLEDERSRLSSRVIQLEGAIKDMWGDIDELLRRAVEFRKTNTRPAPPAEQIKNWLRVQANSEKDEKLKAIFVECHNAAHKIICEYSTRPAPPAEAVTDDAREAALNDFNGMLEYDAEFSPDGAYYKVKPTDLSKKTADAIRTALQSPANAVDAEVIEALRYIERIIAPDSKIVGARTKARNRAQEALALISPKDGQDGA